VTESLQFAAFVEIPGWEFEPSIVVPLLLTAALYGFGWQRCSTDRPRARWELASFVFGWLVLVAALLSPLHPLGEELFVAHMAQHEVLMLAAAPLLVFSRMDQILPWAFPIAFRRKLLGIFHSRLFHSSSLALVVHAVAIWGWHIPALYQASIRSEFVHASQHLSFLLSALWFWWTLFYSMASKRMYGSAAAYVFVTGLHTSILGAILTFSSHIWYPIYGTTTPQFGLSTLQDQQLGGLLMWIPANLVYIAIGLWLLRAWIIESDRRLPLTRLATLMAAQEKQHA
jgi:cytochrome c oxidase assembly factor CtaG